MIEMVWFDMTFEEFIQMKSKEEVAFIFYGDGIYKHSCINCKFYEPDKYGVWKCNSFLESKCRQEFIDFLQDEMDGLCGITNFQ